MQPDQATDTSAELRPSRAKTNRLAHRVAWEAARPFTEGLGCGIRLCINPNHLAAVSHLDNTIEMLERQAYLRRIADLEKALGALDPDHVLLVRRPKPLDDEGRCLCAWEAPKSRSNRFTSGGSP